MLTDSARRLLIAALAGACLAVAPGTVSSVRAQSASPDPGATSPAASVLTGAAAWRQLVGNTIVATSRGTGYVEYYAADGAVTHLDPDGKATGTWNAQGEKVCFDFPEEDDRNCVSVEVNGGKGAFIDEDASRDAFEILPGNAKHL